MTKQQNQAAHDQERAAENFGQSFDNAAAAVIDWRAREAVRENNARARLEANKPVILGALRDAGFTGAVAGYNGSGDSGQIESLVPTTHEDELEDFDDSDSYLDEPNYLGFPADHRVTLQRDSGPQTFCLAEATREIAWDALELGYAGWENNDGARGVIVLDVARNKIEVRHGWYVTNVESDMKAY